MRLGTWFDVATFLLCWLAAFAVLQLVEPAAVAWWHRRSCRAVPR